MGRRRPAATAPGRAEATAARSGRATRRTRTTPRRRAALHRSDPTPGPRPVRPANGSGRRAHHPARPRAGHPWTLGRSPPAAPHAWPKAIRLDQRAVRRHPAPHPVPGLDRGPADLRRRDPLPGRADQSAAALRRPDPRRHHRCPTTPTRRETRPHRPARPYGRRLHRPRRAPSAPINSRLPRPHEARDRQDHQHDRNHAGRRRRAATRQDHPKLRDRHDPPERRRSHIRRHRPPPDHRPQLQISPATSANSNTCSPESSRRSDPSSTPGTSPPDSPTPRSACQQPNAAWRDSARRWPRGTDHGVGHATREMDPTRTSDVDEQAQIVAIPRVVTTSSLTGRRSGAWVYPRRGVRSSSGGQRAGSLWSGWPAALAMSLVAARTPQKHWAATDPSRRCATRSVRSHLVTASRPS